MASMSALFLLATLLLVTQVAHGETVPSITYPSKPKPVTPVVKPPTPVVKPPTPVVKPPTPVVNPPTPVVNPPTPVVKPPTPVVKPPTPVVKPPSPVPSPAVPVPAPVYKPPSPVSPPPTPVPPPAMVPPIKSLKECGPLCSTRCGNHSRQNVCLRACGTCCRRCRCVPPGTYGNRDLCGTCYSQMKTHNNQFKCP